ncbi:CHAT domain-containing protein [Roridomyces roridus]|uniref:CHAT domain-containing protein n=1 Tax=Roridomyces roridus TaxID=1738132 RepID=A0AAD7B437_9AGAR|nr:CHAT domain-containing protein [Roridomyces roridus]
MHERTLLLPTSDDDKAEILDVVGHIFFRQWDNFHSKQDLDQTVVLYGDAVRIEPNNPLYLADLGKALFTCFQHHGSLIDLNKSVTILEASVALTPKEDTEKLDRLHCLSNSLVTRFKQLGNPTDLSNALAHKEAVLQVSNQNPQKPIWLDGIAICLNVRFEMLGDINDLNEAISLQETAMHLIRHSEVSPYRQVVQHNLGHFLRTRFERLGDIEDLNRGLDLLTKLVSHTPESDPKKSTYLTNLSLAFYSRFRERSGELSDLDQAISNQRVALSLVGIEHPETHFMLAKLGTLLSTRYEQKGHFEDLNESVLSAENAVNLTPDEHVDKPANLNILATALLTRYEQFGSLEDLHKSISLGQLAVSITSDQHSSKPIYLNNLANTLRHSFEQLQTEGDLEKATELYQHALSLTPNHHPTELSLASNLAKCLENRFEQTGNIPDLQEALSIYELALSMTPQSHPDCWHALINLSSSLQTRFRILGDQSDLEKSVLLKEKAVLLVPDGHTGKRLALNNLGNGLYTRFKQNGDLQDINRAVAVMQKAVDSCVDDGYIAKPMLLDQLGLFLLTRHERLGDMGDLRKANSLLHHAVSLAPDNHWNKASMLNNLGNCQYTCYQKSKHLDNLEAALTSYFEAVALTPEKNPDLPMWLNSLALCQSARAQALSNMDDLNEAIENQKEAISLTHKGDPNIPLYSNNLANSLVLRFQRLNNVDDLNTSVRLRQDCVSLTPENHPDTPLWYNNLAGSLLLRYHHSGDTNDLEEVRFQLGAAACSDVGRTEVRFDAAVAWAHITEGREHLTACQAALDLLQELAWVGLPITDRHDHIKKAGVFVRSAVTAAIVAGKLEQAVEWMEEGRSIIWSQLLNLRSPVDDLRLKHPTLADELLSLSAQLEQAGTRTSGWWNALDSKQRDLDSIAQTAHESAQKRADLLKKIRGIGGFKRFLLPKPSDELANAAQQGPVVLINCGSTRCDALVLRNKCEPADMVLHIPLPDFTPGLVQSLAKSLQDFVSPSGRGDPRLILRRDGTQNTEEMFETLLSELWIKLVKPILHGLGITNPGSANLQRVWWCLTGPLVFLPIHAAGIYGKHEVIGSKLSDFVISSYTPSLTALIPGFRPRSVQETGGKILVVAQPSAEGQIHLPGTEEEIRRIRQHAKDKVPLVCLQEDQATVPSVQQSMEESSWVHFACHGTQNATDPTESALLLAGSTRLTLSSILNLSLPHAELAFLSACQTATGATGLQDEAVHLAAGMIFAGYRGAIATMWSIMDGDAPRVAGDVYEHLLETSTPDPARAAEALHLAVQKLRAPGKPFSHWVPYIHIGV